MTTTLLDRLTAAIDEDERIARDAGGGEWHLWNASSPGLVVDAQDETITNEDDWGRPSAAHAAHIIRQNPKATLIRASGDREIVEFCGEVIGDRDLSAYGEFGALRDDPQALAVTLAIETIRRLAKGYNLTVEED
jgi:Family of unknown function (DUF6221)